MDPARLPALDGRTILRLQAGEVNTGEFDPFAELVPRARAAGAWAHVDGAFGLTVRAAAAAHLAAGVEGADSWTTDGHKWLNTPYDGAMAICRDPEALAQPMNDDAVYATAGVGPLGRAAQKNLTLEFSRRARSVPVRAAPRTLGREGVGTLVDRYRAQARRLADGPRAAGFDVVNRVVLNQVLVRGADDAATLRARADALAAGRLWLGATVWQGRPAFRLSVSSWRTTDADVDAAVACLARTVARGPPSAG